MRRALVIAVFGSLVFAGAAYATYPYNEGTDVYTPTASITPFKSGTVASPQPADFAFSYTVDTNPSGARPGLTRNLTIVQQGMGENSTNFPVCSAATLAKPGPSGCPTGSKVGSGFMVLEEGPTNAGDQSFDVYCSLDEALYNSGGHHLTLYITEGAGEGDYDPCTLPGDTPVSVDVRLAMKNSGGTDYLAEVYTLPPSILHPDAMSDASIIQDQWEIPIATTPVTTTVHTQVKQTYTVTLVKFKVVVRKGHRVKVKYTVKVQRTRTVTKTSQVTHRVGFIATDSCPSSGQRLVSAQFTESDGISHQTSATSACSS